MNERTIFENALDLNDPKERAAYLEKACGQDDGIRTRIGALLHSHEQAGSFLQSAAGELAVTELPQISEQPGTLIGPYKIREQLAEGGMGVVYVADQAKPVRRRVALKVIKPGMATKDVVARFEAERQALAMMDHPHIAHIFDGGVTESGQPFFAMELIQGLPITQYCDEHQLTSVQRLELFGKVCKAVQHAHQKGIIHRDIKPSNVLIAEIDGAAVPKIIDFGVAKAVSQKLTDQTIYTQFSQMVGTPLYMSPEQVSLGTIDIDTRSDVYSLGVLLYELLTGKTPFDREIIKQSGFDEFRRVIREDEPQRPSAAISTLQAQALSTVAENHHIDPRKLGSELKGELDWIVMRALEKDRNRRYETASSFAADIERYLKDEPVEACPPSKVYRLQKFTKRNKAALITAMIVTVSLLLGTGVSVWQAHAAHIARGLADERLVLANERLERETKAKEEAEEQRKLANENFQQAREAVDRHFTLVSESTLLDEPGLQPLRLELLEATVDYYKTFADSRIDDPVIQIELAAAHLRLGQIYNLLNRPVDRQNSFERGFTLIEKTVQRIPAESKLYVTLAGFWHGGRRLNGGASQTITDSTHAHFVLEKGIKLWERFVELHPEEGGFQGDLSKLYDTIAHRQNKLGRPSDALISRKRVLELRKNLVRNFPNVPAYKAELAFGYLHHARRIRKDDSKLADEYYRLAIAQLEGEVIQTYRIQLASIYFLYGKFLLERNQPDEMYKQYQKGIGILNELVIEYPHTSLYQKRHVDETYNLFKMLIQAGQFDEAKIIIDKMKPTTASDYAYRANFYQQLKEWDKALADYDKAIELDPEDESWWGWRLKFFCTRERWQDASNELAKTIKLKPDDYYSRYQFSLVSLAADDHISYRENCQKMLSTFVESDEPMATHFTAWTCALAPNALEDYAPAIQLARNAVEKEPGNKQHLNGYGAILMRAGQYEAAKIELEKALAAGESDSTSSSYIRYFLAMTEHHLGHKQAALDHLQTANNGAKAELEDTDNPPAWNRKLTLELLRKEAEALINQANDREETTPQEN